MADFKKFINTILITTSVFFFIGYLRSQIIENRNISVLENQVIKLPDKVKNAKNIDFNYKHVRDIDLSKSYLQNINQQQFIAIISIPRVDLKVPISEGINKLNYSAGTLKPDQKIGYDNYSIIGHNLYNNSKNVLFSKLGKAKKNDIVYLYNKKVLATYKIYTIQTINNSNIDVIKDTKKAVITMITCSKNNDTKKRLMVRGKLIDLVKRE